MKTEQHKAQAPNEFSERYDQMIGMHFEYPKFNEWPEPARSRFALVMPPNNWMGGHILDRWIKAEMDREQLGAGRISGELNSCTGLWTVSDIGRSLELVERIMETLVLTDGLELGWFCRKESVWRIWRPEGKLIDFARHFTLEARTRNEQQMAALLEMIEDLKGFGENPHP